MIDDAIVELAEVGSARRESVIREGTEVMEMAATARPPCRSAKPLQATPGSFSLDSPENPLIRALRKIVYCFGTICVQFS